MDQAPGVPIGAAFVLSPEPEAVVFDRADMMIRLMDDEDMTRTVAKGFLEDSPRHIAALNG